MPSPQLIGSTVPFLPNVAGITDQASVAGLTGGNLAVCTVHTNRVGHFTGVTIEVQSGQNFDILTSTTLDFSVMGMTIPPTLTAMPDGTFVVSWSGTFAADAGWRPIWQQTYDATGLAIGAPRMISDINLAAEGSADVAMLTQGHSVYAYNQFTVASNGNPGGWDVVARLVEADGELGAIVPLNTATGYSEGDPQVSALADGGFLALWLRDDVITSAGRTQQMILRVFEADGTPRSDEIVLMSTHQSPDANESLGEFDLVQLTGGQIAISWRMNYFDGDSYTAVAQVAMLGTDGSVLLPGYVAPADLDGGMPEMTALRDGRLFFTWSDGAFSNIGTVNERTWGAYVSAEGIVSEPFELVPAFNGYGAAQEVTELADGRLLLTFFTYDQSGNIDQMRQILDPREAGIDLTGTAQPNSWVGSAFGDVLNGNGGHDVIDGGAGADVIRGGNGADSVYGGSGLNQLFGDEGADYILAGDDGDLIGGGADNDMIRGGAGADTIYGGRGHDNIGGGGGDDVIHAVEGANVIWGGFGNDTVNGGSGGDEIYGGPGRNQLFGNEGADYIQGGNDGNLIGGGAGQDVIRGGTGQDTIYGGLGHDNIGGGAGNDLIVAVDGANDVWGGLGDDTIHAGTGRDAISGGPGADVFVFASAAMIGIAEGRDAITDFSSGVDKIDLRGLGTVFNGAGGLLGGGQGSFYYFAERSLLIGDQNGDGVPDWVLELRGAAEVMAEDFLL